VPALAGETVTWSRGAIYRWAAVRGDRGQGLAIRGSGTRAPPARQPRELGTFRHDARIVLRLGRHPRDRASPGGSLSRAAPQREQRRLPSAGSGPARRDLCGGVRADPRLSRAAHLRARTGRSARRDDLPERDPQTSPGQRRPMPSSRTWSSRNLFAAQAWASRSWLLPMPSTGPAGSRPKPRQATSPGHRDVAVHLKPAPGVNAPGQRTSSDPVSQIVAMYGRLGEPLLPAACLALPHVPG
jgi:hypothetical protein